MNATIRCGLLACYSGVLWDIIGFVCFAKAIKKCSILVQSTNYFQYFSIKLNIY